MEDRDLDSPLAFDAAAVPAVPALIGRAVTLGPLGGPTSSRAAP